MAKNNIHKMDNKNGKPPVESPRIGNSPFTLADVSRYRGCQEDNCMCTKFYSVKQTGFISRLNPKNDTGQDIRVEMETLKCVDCGAEVKAGAA